MGNVLNAVHGIFKKLRSRVAAVSMLALVCVMLAVVITANLTSVSIYDGNEVKTVITMRRDTKTILNKASIAVSVNDKVVETSIDENSRSITILRAFPVTITSDGQTVSLDTVGGTVADVLAEAGIVMPDGDDLITPAMDTIVAEGQSIVVQRVSYEEKTSEVKVPFKTEKVKDSSLAKGKTKVSVKGVNGVKRVVTRYKYIDGKQVDSEVVSSKVVTKPVNEKVLVGTKINRISTSNSYGNKVSVDTKSGSLTVNGQTISYKKVLKGKGTAYTARDGAKCSTGVKAAVGRVAVNPKVIPYGTKLFITSADGKYVYGYAVASDTGGALLSGRVLCDLYMNTEAECYRFGRRNINVYVL